MPRPPDSLQAAGDRLRRLDLDDEVDGAHVDPELERRGRDEAWNPAGLQLLLDEHPLLAGKAAVMCTRNLPVRLRDSAFGVGGGELVEPESEAFGQPAVVDEHDRRAVGLDECEQLGVHRRPDRATRLFARAVRHLAFALDGVVERAARAELAQIVDGNNHLQVELLRRPGVDELDRPAARDETADLLERPLGRREADPLRRGRGQPFEPLEREREVRSALRSGDGVDLVDDHRRNPSQRLARRRGEHQVERLGRRDQDVGRLLDELAALLRRRVARANADAERRLEPGERPA